MNLTKRVEFAIKNAYVPPTGASMEYGNSRLAALDDYEEVKAHDVEPEPYEIMHPTDEPEGLAATMREFYRQTRGAVSSYDEHWIDQVVTHELQHFAALSALGRIAASTEAMFSLVITKEVGEYLSTGQLVLMKYAMPKLALMSLAVHPIEPSDGDLQFVRSAGYDGVVDLGDKIVTHNKRFPDNPFAVPLSYK